LPLRSSQHALGLLLAGVFSLPAWGQIDSNNWGYVTAPVFGVTEKAPYAGADLFAGPNKFGSYYQGVLPNGRIVKPAGTTIQVGMNPLGVALTPDGKYLITSNDDEREGGFTSLQSTTNMGGYSLSVVDTGSMTVVSQISTAGTFFIGLQATGTGPYTLWASGGPENNVKLFSISASGTIAAGSKIAIPPTLPATAGYVTNYNPDAALNTIDANGNKPALPSGMSATANPQITFPAGMALSPDGKYLYVACNGDNSVAVIDTAAQALVKQVAAGYFPYGVAVSPTGDKVVVSNWGITEYKFAQPAYDPATGKLTAVGMTGQNEPVGYFVPATSGAGANPKTSSVSIMVAPGGNGAALAGMGAVYHGKALDALYSVGDTHPSAMAVVKKGSLKVLYVAKSNDDSLGIVILNDNRKEPDFSLAPVNFTSRPPVHGAYPNALAASPDNTRLYVAEAGLNSVAVLDVSAPLTPKLLGRIPTSWYLTGVAVSPDGHFLYISNAKGIGEDINPATATTGTAPPTGLASYSGVDSNYIFGTVQKVDLRQAVDNTTVLGYNFAMNPPTDISIVPAGGAASSKIKHVIFILQENKTFDSMLGNLKSRFGAYASMSFNDKTGAPYTNGQYTGVALNLQRFATTFAAAVNYYSDSEESDAGHQFSASGTASDYTEKTLLVKSGRGLLVNKNFEPEDYPEAGYIFNNAARNGVSFKDYGALVRIQGTDTGTSAPTWLNDLFSGNAGYPMLQSDSFSVTSPLKNAGDVVSETQGLGQSYFMNLPILAVLGGSNPNGEPRLDHYYPGYNFNISDQRRAQEFNADFDGMIAQGTLPQFLYIYLPNNHTGGLQAPNAKAIVTSSGIQQIADGDAALGMVVNHIMSSPIYYDPATDTGSVIFMSQDDAQSSLDHIHPHRTPLVVVSPFAKPAYSGLKHYSTASIVKTEELLLGLPPNNLGDLFATDLRDMFQPTYNGISATSVPATVPTYSVTTEGLKIWSLVSNLNTASPDQDSERLGLLTRLSMQADYLRREAEAQHKLRTRAYRQKQEKLYRQALQMVKDGDDN
jgi:YVTN family beta-propeller protein